MKEELLFSTKVATLISRPRFLGWLSFFNFKCIILFGRSSVMSIKRPTWDEMFMFHAISAGVRSSCLVRGVGAVLVRDKRIIASGYNGAPPDIETCLDKGECFYQRLAHDDAEKGLGTFEILKEERKSFCNAAHAEKNALSQCSSQGIKADGADLYSTNHPCPGCVRDVIVPNHIRRVIVWKEYLQNKMLTHDEYSLANFWLQQAGIKVCKMELSRARMEEIFSLMLKVGDRTSYKFNAPVTLPLRS
jgi:dCMP deaminase